MLYGIDVVMLGRFDLSNSMSPPPHVEKLARSFDASDLVVIRNTFEQLANESGRVQEEK